MTTTAFTTGWEAYLCGPPGSYDSFRIGFERAPEDAQRLAVEVLGQQARETDTWQPHGSHRFVLTDADGEPIQVLRHGVVCQAVVAERDLPVRKVADGR